MTDHHPSSAEHHRDHPSRAEHHRGRSADVAHDRDHPVDVDRDLDRPAGVEQGGDDPHLHDLALVVDLGSPRAQLLARRIRGAGVYSEVVPASMPVEQMLARRPRAIVAAVPDIDPAPSVDPQLAAAGVPLRVAADADDEPNDGATIVGFVLDEAGCRPTWTIEAIVADQIARISDQIGEGHAICGLSGGVDSAVAAALVQRAIGERLTCVFVDHGLLRQGEVEQVERDFVAATGIRLHTVDARDRFLDALAGVTDPEQKRKIIGREFIRVFEAAEREILADHEVGFLVQGTLYPDVVESLTADGSVSVKSHHNVGGLPEDLEFELVEPLRDLFKDEVRLAGEHLGLPPQIVWRHPFPGPGLGIRIVGEVTRERLDILRAADAIAREELTAAGLDRDIWQFPVVLLGDVRSVGVGDSGRTYGHPVVLRPVVSEDAMTADWGRLPYDLLDRISTRITAEVPQINRVVLDVTRKPPGTIEWE